MSFDDPDNEPRKTPAFATVDVYKLSIEELHAYIAHARDEIARAEAEIAAKRSLRGDADALFRS